MIWYFIYLSLLWFCPVVSSAQARSNDEGGKIILGVERRTDKFCRDEFHIKYLNKYRSFSLKFATYDYIDGYGYVGIKYNGGQAYLNNFGYSVGEYNYRVKGFAVKPGWIAWHYLHKYLMLSATGSLVITSNKHQFELKYPNYNQLKEVHDIAVGLEYEFLFGFRIIDNFLLSGAVQFGGKPGKTYLFNDVIQNFPQAYDEYAPAQGSRENSRLYVNATLGLSFIF
jgi:hypothetical protein